jgi:hypothetical protein
MPLEKGVLTSGVQSSPSFQQYSPSSIGTIITGVYLEEVPSTSGGVQSINVLNQGFGYTTPPNVKILGDGTGATAVAVISGGQIREIVVTNPGTNYTQAIVEITNASNDTTGMLGAASTVLEGRYGTIRSYYIDSNNIKTVSNPNVGSIDYEAGTIYLNNLSVLQVDNLLGQLGISAIPRSNIMMTNFNQILTIDPNDASAINITVTAK